MKKITTPYSFESQDYFTILPFEDKVIQHLENIIKNENEREEDELLIRDLICI